MGTLKPIAAHRENYARLNPKSKVLHKRVEPDGGFDGSAHYTRCGRYIDLGREATPLIISEEYRLCRSCMHATF